MLLTAPGSSAVANSAQRLVDAYSPIVMLREQTEDPPCNSSQEQFEPTTVDTMLGNPRVQLEAAGTDEEVTTAPTAADIAGLGGGYHLNIPGDPLHPECGYAEDFATLKAQGKAPAITYARIATEKRMPGLVVQYWFFYYFNQFNDLHEGDWEGMQVAFDANSPSEALDAGPSEIALFQHEGGEKARWGDSKVQKEGTHPVVYPAAGSHATFYGPAVYVENARGGSGLGCDNTTEPLRRVEPRPVLVPTHPRTNGRFKWLTFRGHWGQKETGYANGPQGPIEKLQWNKPFTWMSGVRTRSPELPSGFFLGPQVTGAFCGTVKAASSLVNLDTESRPAAIGVVVGFILLVIVLLRLTRWRPVELAPLRQTRALGQLLRASRQLYGRHWRPLVLMGLTSIPIIGAVYGVQLLLGEATRHSDAVHDIVQSIGHPIGYAVVAAIVIVFVRDLDRGLTTGFGPALQGMRERFWRVVLGQLAANFLVLLLALTIIGLPIAIWKYIDWQFVQQEILFEDKPVREALRGSTRIVRGHWWRTLRVAGFLWLISIVTGPVLGFALIFTPLSLTWANVAGTVVFALLIPYVAIGRTLLYFDLAVRQLEAVSEPKRRRRWWSRARPSPQPG
jgi:hypothetical protein